MVVVLSRNSKRFVISIFREDEINEICSQKHRLSVNVLNKSFEKTLEIKKNQPLGLLAIEPENLKFEYATANEKKKTDQKKISTLQTKNDRGNLAVFLTVMTLLTPGEILLIKQQKLLLA